VSDLARNYVKQLPRSRVTAAQKKFLFFLADYHNVDSGYAWPSMQTLAEDMSITVRQVRNLLRQCQGAGLIDWMPGCGAGNFGRFAFVELKAKEELKGEPKAETKGEISRCAIRKERRTLNHKPLQPPPSSPIHWSIDRDLRKLQQIEAGIELVASRQPGLAAEDLDELRCERAGITLQRLLEIRTAQLQPQCEVPGEIQCVTAEN
jgi:hypothetical protein